MKTSRAAAVMLVGLAMLGGGSLASAQNYLNQGTEQFFRVESESGHTRKGAPTVSGYIYNKYGSAAVDVRVLVETLDASGQTVDRKLYPLFGSVPGDGRAYFEFKVPPAAGYRVRVASWNWLRGGGG